jgi:serine/threonine protein kinase
MSPKRWQQVEELYHAAREREASGREAFVRTACGADEELRREVLSLLDQDVSRDGILERSAADFLEGESLEPGAQLGPYRIEASLGRGGMGEVFRARDTRLGRMVAIKTVSERFAGRFERESRAISALNHPHICTLYDVGASFLVMELLEGETLEERMRKGPMPIEDVALFGAQIADALAAAHAMGIVHRDLKPGNVMLTAAGVKLLDFGVAKFKGEYPLASGVAAVTASRQILGTPAYMAPEQLLGEACDARTDIYSLGRVLYEMAAGRRAAREPEPAVPGVAPEMARTIVKCLAVRPEDRWQSARELRAELAKAREPERRPSWWRRLYGQL